MNCSEKGQEYERVARFLLPQRGLKLLGKNLRLGKLEIDLLAFDERSKEFVVIEVRGRESSRYLPSDYFQESKKKRVMTWAAVRLAGEKYRIELWELIGVIPAAPLKRKLFYTRLRFRPQGAGITLKTYEL